MFNGRNLDGWDGDPRVWKVRDALNQNSFLITRKTSANFVLRTEVRLRNGNSGIQFRSEAPPDWVVRGLPVEVCFRNLRIQVLP